ncbi:MAG: ABC transporter ATP-binding protein [Muribaculaceae bacterium]|nr:ABC transporter ATP-binding protein [Muribaculaceae bacterium]
MANILELNGLSVGYDSKVILSDINFSLGAGNMAVLIGSNGCGKSTLMRTIAGVQPPIAGSVAIDGKKVEAYSRRELARRLAVVSTERIGGGALTAEECVAIGRYPYTGLFGRLSAEDKEIVGDSLNTVGMTDKANRYVGTLSDGERQKIMIARALAQQTGLIVLDEPTSFLDVAGRIDTMRLLRRLADRGHTILVSTHDIAPAIVQADTILAIDAGQRRIYSGSKADIIASGALDLIFAGSGLYFDKQKGDYHG